MATEVRPAQKEKKIKTEGPKAKEHEHTKSRTEIAGIAVCCSYRRRKEKGSETELTFPGKQQLSWQKAAGGSGAGLDRQTLFPSPSHGHGTSRRCVKQSSRSLCLRAASQPFGD